MPMSIESGEPKEPRRKYKPVYGYAACMLTIVILGTIALKKKQPIVIINKATAAPIINTTVSALAGHLRKIVYCQDLDRYFGSVKEAAEFANVSAPIMSKHLNGHTDHVNQMVWKIVAVAN